MGNGGQVLEFWNVALHAMAESWLPLLILLLPPLCLTVFGRFFHFSRPKRWYLLFAALALAFALHFGIAALLPAAEETGITIVSDGRLKDRGN